MISFLRKISSSWVVLGLLGLIMVAFVITGVGTRSGGLGELGQGPDRVATIGGEAVTVPEFNAQLQRALNQQREQQPDIDMARFVREGGFDGLLSEIINLKTLTDFGVKQGLAASKRMIDGIIAGVPGFQNAAGQFDENEFQRALANAKVTEPQLRDDIRSQLVQRQLVLPIAMSPRIPLAMARQYTALLLESRTGTVGVVPAQAVGPGRDPGDAEIAAFYQRQQARYMIPERRVLRYAVFGLDNVAAAAKATDAEIASFYNNHTADYAARESRTLSQVILPSEQAARDFAAKASGGSFVQAAQQAGFAASDIALGTQTKDAVETRWSAAVANAAFAAAPGSISAPIRSPLGWHVIKIDAVKTTPARPLAAVRDEIAAQIGQQKAQDALSDLSTKIEDAIANGASFEEVTRNNGMQISETPPVTATGTTPDAPAVQLAPEVRPLLKQGCEMGGDDDPIVQPIVPNQRYALVALGRIVPAAPPPLARIKDQVKADLVRMLSLERARALAQQISDKVNSGTPIRDAFGQAGVPLPAVQPVTARRLDIAQKGREVPPPLLMIFNLTKGKARILPAPNGAGFFVVRLDDIVPGNIDGAPGLVEATRGQFNQVVGDEYAEQFSHAVEREVKVKRNQESIAQMKQRLLANGEAAE